MKKILFVLLALNTAYAQPPGEWTWMKGNNTTGGPGVFGTQGVPNPANTPPSFYEAMEWTDHQGNFWLFGGSHGTGSMYADLWKYDPVTNQWTWMKGPGTAGAPGVYGVLGVPSPLNYPPPRVAGGTWVDSTGNLWLLGGGNYFAAPRNDLWRYNILTNEWTWMKGPNVANQPGVYGTIGVPAPTNVPGGRTELGTTWSDNNNLWIFGGFGLNNTAATGGLSDFWRYSITTNEWTWMHGPMTQNAPANYGVIGVPNPANTPGGRYAYAKWKDLNGDFWVFGGNTGAGANLSDLWRFNPVSLVWTWMSGSNLTVQPGIQGTVCTPATGNRPVAKYENRACWIDACGHFWSYAGATDGGFGSTFNDLWKYNPVTNEWTFINGSMLSNVPPTYGAITISAPANNPGGRCGQNAWYDNATGNLFLFGGGVPGFPTCRNDLWRFVPSPLCGGCSAQPLTVIVTNSTSVCIGACTNVSAAVIGGSAPYTYVWTPNIGNGPGPYSVCPIVTTTYTVLVTDSAGNTATDSMTVTVNPLPVILISPPAPSICVGDSTLLTATGATLYAWSPCTDLNPCTGSAVMASPAVSTPYTVTGTDANGCTATASVTVTVNPLPLVVSPPAPSICIGGSVVLTMSGAQYYRWSPQTGLSNPNGPDSTIVTATLTSSQSYTVTGYSAEGCWDTITFTVVVNPDPIAVITADGPLTFCPGGQVTLTASGGVSFLWSDSSTSASILVNTSGTYIVTVTDSNGCDGSTSETVTVHPAPAAVISPAGPVLICSTTPATLSANTGPGYTYQWFHNTILLAGEINSTLTVSVTGDYTVQITDSNGCMATSIPVQVLEGLGPDVIIVGPPAFGCLQNTIYIGFGPQSVTLTAVSSTAVSYLWSTGETTQSISVTTSNTYSVTAYDANGCPSVSTPESQITINVVDIRCGQGKKKIILCHVPEGNPSNPQTICVAPSAIPFHLEHHQYDCLGPCSLYYPRMTLSGNETYVTLHPNPFNNSFMITVENGTEEMSLNLFDVTGRLIIGDFRFSESVEMGEDLPKGVYNIEIIAGEKREVFKLVKL